MAKTSIKIKGLNEYLETLNKIGGNVNQAVESALIATHQLITKQVKEALRYGVPLKNGGKSKAIEMSENGDMLKSFMDIPQIHWIGNKAVVQVGFDQSISMHATYMMITGTAYTEPSKNLYNAIYGPATKKKIVEIQSEVLTKVIERSR